MNAKSEINTYGQKKGCKVTYETLEGKKGFLSFLTVGNNKYYGKEMKTKKDAEEEVAKVALLDLKIEEDWYPKVAEFCRCPDKEALNVVFGGSKDYQEYDDDDLRLIGSHVFYLHLLVKKGLMQMEKDIYIKEIDKKMTYDDIIKWIAVVYLKTNIDNAFRLIKLIFNI